MPWTAGVVDIENAIEDGSEVLRLPSWPPGLPLGFGQKRLDDLPWRIAAMCWRVIGGAQAPDSFSQIA